MHPLWRHIVLLIYLMARRMLASDVCPPASSKGRYCHVYLWTAGHPFPNSVLTPFSLKHLLNSILSVLPCYSMYKSAGLCPSYSIVSVRIHLLPLLTHHRFKSRSEGHPVSNLTPKLSDKWPYANLSNTPVVLAARWTRNRYVHRNVF